MLAHPWVADAGVISRPDADLGEVPVVHLSLAADAPAEDEALAAISEHVAERLAAVKNPRDWVVHETLPRDPNGKLYKKRLRDERPAAAQEAV